MLPLKKKKTINSGCDTFCKNDCYGVEDFCKLPETFQKL